MNQKSKTKIKNKRKIFRVSIPEFLDFFRGEHKYRIIQDEIPVNTKVIDTRFNGFKNSVDFLIESEEFKELEEGKEIPFLNPIITTEKKTEKWYQFKGDLRIITIVTLAWIFLKVISYR